MKKISGTQRKQLTKFFLRMMLLSFIAVLLIGGIVACTVGNTFDKIKVASRDELDPNLPQYNRNEDADKEGLHLNVAVFGVDKDESRTDVIFVVHFNSETGKSEIISVPRDTKVTWSDYQIEKAEELDRYIQNPCKITEMSSFGGIDNIRYFTVNALEDILGVKIDHYVVVDINAFRKIVDAIGGVTVDVPRRMEYTDTSQDLYIDLEPGMQTLDGIQAEGLVRWRHNNDYSEQYAEGDTGRIETQQLFLTAFAKKVMSPQVLKAIPQMINILYSDVQTDVTLKDVSTYLGYIDKFDTTKLNFETLPGEFVREEKWYYMIDYDEVDEFVAQRFNDKLGVTQEATVSKEE